MNQHAVLLVDDDENLLCGLRRALHRQPFQIFTARGGEEALALLKTHNIDVIVADERMPGLSGNELLAWVAENCPQVMRIILTAYAETNSAIRAINEAGVFRYFTKPCNEARLVTAIHQAIEEKASLQQQCSLRQNLEQQLRELQRANQDFVFQTRVIAQDLHRPVEHLLSACRRLDEAGCEMSEPVKQLLGEVQNTAAECLRLIEQLRQLTPAPFGE